MTPNRWKSGGLVVLAGAAKGFNETLQFHYKAFHRRFPGANPRWFNPDISWRNKYRGGNPNAGPRFPLSKSLLVATTDQYHLNLFVQRTAWVTALVIRIGEGKRPFKYYLKDFLFYTACHQLGFYSTYFPFRYGPQRNR